MFVGFLYTCVSIFVRFLIISMPIKEILLLIGSSIVKDRLGWRLLRVLRKSVAASVLGILTKVSSTYLLYICYSPAGRSELGKTGPEVLDTARGRWSRAVLKTEGTVFPNTDRPRRVNNIFIFFYNTTKGVRTTRTFSGCNHGKIRDKLNNF